MRFAAIADIHGNYLALEAVLADIRARGIDAIVNLGDMVSGPLDARRTMDVLKALDAVHVLGNHDRYLIDRPHEKMGSWERDVYTQLDASDLDGCARCRRGGYFEIASFCATRRLRATRPIGWKPRCPTATSPCRRFRQSRKPRKESRSR
jgi:3',5'-cyclic AMP phosphodiesterase CpdA